MRYIAGRRSPSAARGIQSGAGETGGQSARRLRATARWSAAFAATIAIAGGALRPAAASTDGSANGLETADGILQVMGFNFTLENIFSTPVTEIDVSASRYGYIKNDYIGAVIGYIGTYSTQLDTTHTVAHTSPGIITFGNLKGSLLSGLDEQQGLTGLNYYDFQGVFTANQGAGFGGWPIPNYARYQDDAQVEFGAYTRAIVDGAQTNVVGSDNAKTLIPPRFTNNALGVQYNLLTGTGNAVGAAGNGNDGLGIGGLPSTAGSNDVVMDEVIELYRSTARIHWRLYNGDSNPHTVTLRFTLPVRAASAASQGEVGLIGNAPGGFYYVDPALGLTTDANVIPATSLPDIFTVYGQRYDDPNSTTVPPFAAKTVFRGFGATTPTMVYLSDPIDVYPAVGGFYQNDVANRNTRLGTGIAESLYFGPYTLAPGAIQDIYTYYGNGSPTEDLRDDVVIGVESVDAVQFNTDAINSPSVLGNRQIVTDPTQLANAEALFLQPNPIKVAGSVYNRTLSQNFTSLTDVSMSLILPSSGLVFTTPPGSTKVDIATKAVGSVPPDTDVPQLWYIKATGTDYGVLNYQLTTSSKEVGARSVTRQISIPAIPLHPVTNTSFQLLGFPFQFDQGATNQADPATIINTLSPASLQDNPAIFYQWIPAGDSIGNDNGHYVIASSIQPGQGYFFRPATSRILFPYGAAPISGQTPNSLLGGQSGSVIQLSLNQGWNMITNPYLYSIPLAQLRVTQSLDGQLSGTSSPFLTAANAGLVRGDVFFFDTTTGAYDFFDFSPANPTPTLNPWTGYWLYALQNVIVTFPVPTTHDDFVLPSSTGGEPSTRGVIGRSSWTVKGPSINNWTLQLTASRPGSGSHAKREDRAAIIGVKPGVTTRNAALPKPPTPASDYVYIGLVKPDTKSSTRYAELFQSPSSSAKKWEFEVTSDQAGPVTIQWPNTAKLPRLVDLKVKDLSTNKEVSIRSRSSIQINAQAGRASRFVITASAQNSRPLDVYNVQVVDSGTRALGSKELSFGLTQDAVVDVQVHALNGRVVSTIAASRAVTAGETTHLQWSGRGDNQAALPIGMYVIKFTARTEDGHTVVREKQVNLLR